MKILVVTQYFYPENFKVNDLVLSLKKRGYEVSVLTGKPNYPQGKYYKDYNFLTPLIDDFKGIKVYRAPLISRGHHPLQLLINYLSFVVFASLYALFLVRKPFDRIFVYEVSPITVALPAILFKWMKRIPLYFWVTDLWPESLSATGAVKNKYILRLVSYLVRFIYLSCDEVLLASEAFRDSILKHGGVPAKIKYFPQWAEDLYLVPSDHIKEESLTLMFAGNIGKAQDLQTIVEAAKNTLDLNIKWLIVGDGRDRKRIETMVLELGLKDRFTFFGQKPVEEMPDYFKLADMMLMTLRDEPIFAYTIPAKLQSYLAAGKPILASINGEAQRIIKEADCGVAVNASDAKALAEGLRSIYNAKQSQFDLWGKNAKAYYSKNFERDKLLRNLESWMNK